mmetsp:Transcript_27353/g.66420  ORF Transcript_27353/g.66420 Transcript_27353/m.66420 type:complete len:142 (+) Transcript_27353:92-517(+)
MTRVKSHIIVVHPEQSDVGEEVGEEEGVSLANPPSAICATVGTADASVVGLTDVGEEEGASLANPPSAICATVGTADGSVVGLVVSEVGIDVGVEVGGLVGAGPTLAVHTSQQIWFPARQHDLKGDPSHSSPRLVGGSVGA